MAVECPCDVEPWEKILQAMLQLSMVAMANGCVVMKTPAVVEVCVVPIIVVHTYN